LDVPDDVPPELGIALAQNMGLSAVPATGKEGGADLLFEEARLGAIANHLSLTGLHSPAEFNSLVDDVAKHGPAWAHRAVSVVQAAFAALVFLATDLSATQIGE
jgi:hypothetical protein